MIALVVVVHQVLGEHVPKVAFSEHDHPVEALGLDRPDESFGMGVGVRRQLLLMGNLRVNPYG